MALTVAPPSISGGVRFARTPVMRAESRRPRSGRARLVVTGEVDASNADRLRLAILDAARKTEGQLEVDLGGVTFMDSTGLRAMADGSRALEPCGSRLVLCKVPRQVLRLLAITEIGATLGVRR
jgi:anti-anti-sigma factor